MFSIVGIGLTTRTSNNENEPFLYSTYHHHREVCMRFEMNEKKEEKEEEKKTI